MKKLVSVILALAMCAVFLPGCAPGDVELYNALEKSDAAENYTAVTTLSYKIDVTRPFTSAVRPDDDLYGTWDYDGEAAEYNELLTNFVELGELVKVKAVTAKSGDNSKIDVTLAMPDAEADFTLWQQGENRIIARIPSMVSPFIYNIAGGKPYIYADADELAAMISGGEVPKLSSEFGEQLKNAFVGRLTYPLVTETAQKGDETVYTVRLDAAAIKGLSMDALSVLSEPEVVSLMAAAVYALSSEDSGITLDEFKEGIMEEIEISRLSAEDIFAAIDAGGLLDNGLTMRFTVKDGLVIRREIELCVDFDAEKIDAAIYEDDTVLVINGAFSVSVSAVTDFAYGAAAVDMPVLTAENSINIGAEYAEYMAYEAARESWYENMVEGWENYHAPTSYLYRHSADDPITIKNLENGKEVTVTPGIVVAGENTWQYGIAMPVEEVLSVIDGASMSWNPITLGVEVRYPYISGYSALDGSEAVLFLPNADGVRYLREYWENSDFDYEYYTTVYNGDILSSETVYLLQSYDNIFFEDYYGYAEDGSILGYSPYYDENGKVYADFDDLFSYLGYVCKLEGNVLSIRAENARFSYNGIEDNLFYRLNGDSYYDYYYYRY
ncbi:MAG: hypothetical protein J1F63_06995 [Oscillospiraceae bacterium]|nr:hypothetical protein [Oscillospiraceae bacterium]